MMNEQQKALDQVKDFVRIHRVQMSKEMLRAMDGHAAKGDLVLKASEMLEPFLGPQEALNTVEGLLTLQAINTLSTQEESADHGYQSISIDLTHDELELIEAASSCLGVSPSQFIMIAATQAAVKILQAQQAPEGATKT